MNLLTCSDKLNGFKQKLELWQTELRRGSLEMYQRTRNVPKDQPDYDWKQADHFGFGSKIFNIATTEIWAFYFYTIHTEQYDCIRNLFVTNAENSTEALSLQIREEFLELRNDGTLKLKFTKVPLHVFWIAVKEEYPQISDKAVAVLLPFSTTYLCEQSFSTLVLIKMISGRAWRALTKNFELPC